MLRLKLLFAASLALVVLANLSACASVEIPDFKAHMTLPASRDGFWVQTVSEDEGVIPAAEWRAKLDSTPHIILFSEDWSILRFSILKNCLSMECKQAVGALDGLFYALDNALKTLPGVSGK